MATKRLKYIGNPNPQPPFPIHSFGCVNLAGLFSHNSLLFCNCVHEVKMTQACKYPTPFMWPGLC